MKTALLPTVNSEKTRALTLVRQIVENTELTSAFPKETRELRKYLTDEITTARAIQLIQTIQKG